MAWYSRSTPMPVGIPPSIVSPEPPAPLKPKEFILIPRSFRLATRSMELPSGKGLVFSLNTDGSGYTKLHSFTGVSGTFSTNSDGAIPRAGLVLVGDTLYGTASSGGTAGYGTLFAIKTNGTGFANLHSMTLNDGVHPRGGLIFMNNTLYGMANAGGTPDPYGTIFSLSLTTVTPPTLTISLSGTNVVLAWPTNAPGFTLQFITKLAAAAVWSTNSSATAIVNGHYTVTKASPGVQEFYRLIQ
jgi:uncharacterized repeat protein (TIGR03803 family)